MTELSERHRRAPPRRRSRRRPLTEFASRSPVHALGAWLLRTALLLAIAGIACLVIMNILVPNMIDGLIDEFRSHR